MTANIEREHDVQNLARLQELISAGADVNAHMLTGWTPLSYAAKDGFAEQCRMLLDAGADPERGDQHGQRSALYAAIHHRLIRGISDAQLTAVCELLFAHGANANGIESASTGEATMYLPLYQAVVSWDALAIDLLAAAGADLERECLIPRRSGESVKKTALRAARDVGNQDLMLQLLRLGANDAELGRQKKTPFQTSVMTGHEKLVEYYVCERGESIEQEIDGKKPEDATLSTSTRAIILVLKTNMAVQSGLGNEAAVPGAPSGRKSTGMAL